MNYQIPEVFEIIKEAKHYAYVGGQPIDILRPKYKIWAYWFVCGKLYCFSCGTKADHFKFLPTKGDGSIHIESNLRKYTFGLYSKDHKRFTIDHWYPKWFLKLHRLKESQDNFVPMCTDCNNEKAGSLPLIGRWGNTFYIPPFLKPVRKIYY